MTNSGSYPMSQRRFGRNASSIQRPAPVSKCGCLKNIVWDFRYRCQSRATIQAQSKRKRTSWESIVVPNNSSIRIRMLLLFNKNALKTRAFKSRSVEYYIPIDSATQREPPKRKPIRTHFRTSPDVSLSSLLTT